MHVLNDGTVIPSHFGIEDTATFPEPNETFGNFAPRIGEVKEIIWPSEREVGEQEVHRVPRPSFSTAISSGGRARPSTRTASS
jgi:hypothetical protein